jgi:hypothetical protein
VLLACVLYSEYFSYIILWAYAHNCSRKNKKNFNNLPIISFFWGYNQTNIEKKRAIDANPVRIAESTVFCHIEKAVRIKNQRLIISAAAGTGEKPGRH